MTTHHQPPDIVAHRLATNQGNPVRLSLDNETATIPIEPYTTGSPDTTTIPLASVQAVIEQIGVEDGGMNLASFNGIHLPASEWERAGLKKHWEHDDVDLHDPLTETQRRLELWASRKDNFSKTPPEDYTYDHLDPIPDDSPLLTAWDPWNDDDPDQPPVPFDYPTLSVYPIHGTNADKYDPSTGGFDRVEFGTVVGVDVLSADDLPEWPTEPDIEKRDLDLDLTPPPRHPEIEWDTLTPLPIDPDLLEAVRTLNRHAKQFGDKADTAYSNLQGADARVYAVKKHALYAVKTIAVHRFTKSDPAAVTLERHTLNDTHDMYCLYFPHEYAFHQPLDAVDPDLIDALNIDTPLDTHAIDFEPTTDTSETDYSLPDALELLAAHDLNANAHLETEVVENYDWNIEISTTFDSIPMPSA